MDNSKWDNRFIKLAKLISTWSKDPSTKCGAVITQGKKIISLGFNGFPAGCLDDCYDDRQRKYMRIIHAEMNAILQAKQDLSGCTIYIYPFQPCSNCMAAIIQSGINKIITLPAGQDKLERWNTQFIESTKLAEEAGIELIILPDE